MTIQLVADERPLQAREQRTVLREAQVMEVGAVRYAALNVRGTHYLVREGATSETFALVDTGRAPGEWLAQRTVAPHDTLRETFLIEDDQEGGEVVVVAS